MALSGSPSLRLVMFGTGDFALPAFASLYDTPHQVLALVTQPERTGPGRHQAQASRIKQHALDRGTPVLQPVNVNAPESLAELRALHADLFVVAAYGQILSPEFLAIPPRGSINVHASLLPKYRGASPVEYAIWKGETETGVSIIEVLPRLDAGGILAVVRTPIGPTETAGQLEARLAGLSPPILHEALDAIARGTARPLPQDPALVTRAPKLKKEQGRIDWSQTASQIDCHVRAMQPWPNAFTTLHLDQRTPLRVLVLEVRSCAVGTPGDAQSAPSAPPPGTVVAVDKQSFTIQAGAATRCTILRLQPEGKRPQTAAEFLRGYPVRCGDTATAVDR